MTDPTARILIFAPHYAPAVLGGGPIRTLEAMTQKCSDPDSLLVVTSALDHGSKTPMANVQPDAWTRRRGVKVWYSSAGFAGVLRFLHATRKMPVEFVYLNSVFNFRFGIIPMTLRRLGWWRGAKFITAPRGEFDPGAMRHSEGKKFAFLAVAKAIGLFRAIEWHASNDLEAAHIARIAQATSRIYVKENETLLPAQASEPKGTSGHGPVRFVTVGRIAPKKQLEILIEALKKVDGAYQLEIVGDADDKGYLADLKARARGLGHRVRWSGSASHEAVFEKFRDADYACFPTAGENFGHVTAEALSQACPVVIMDVTPWTEIIRRSGGEVVESERVESWTRVLQQLVDHPDLILPRKTLAAAGYNAWRSRVDDRSFLTYLLESDEASITLGDGSRS